jgi:hypothetical protein
MEVFILIVFIILDRYVWVLKLERWDGVRSEATNLKGDYLTNQDDVKTAAGYVGSDKLGNKNG